MRGLAASSVLILLIAAATGKADESLNFVPLANGQQVSSLALTEDGKYLIAAFPQAGEVGVWDVESGSQVKSIKSATPRILLCRGTSVYVAGGIGLLTAFSEVDGWKQMWQEDMGVPDIVCLSAAFGEAFKNEIVTVVGTDPARRRIILVDTNSRTNRQLGQEGRIDVAAISHDGQTILLQDYLGQSPGGIPVAHSFTEFKRGGMTSLGKSPYDAYPFLYQCSVSDFWFGQCTMYAGVPPKRVWLDSDHLLVPDQTRPLAYSLGETSLKAVELSSTLQSIGSAALHFQSNRKVRPYNGWPWGTFPRGVAATLGKNLFVCCYSDSEKIIYRAQMPAFGAPASPIANGPQGVALKPDTLPSAPKFDPLPTEELIDSIAPTEDGQFLVAAHRTANLITIWDVRTGHEAARLPCPAPTFVLCRGTRAYVANSESGTIRILDQDANWKVEDEVTVGSSGVYYLSAPGGAHFDGHILASCHGTRPFLVDCKGDSHVQAKASGAAATLSYSGSQVVSQAIGTTGPPTVYDFAAFMSGGPPGPRNFNPDSYPFLFQVREGGPWFGGRGMFADLNARLSPLGVIAAPDLMREVVYAIGRGTITAWRANAALAPLGSCTVQTPAFLANFADETERGGRSRTPGGPRVDPWEGYARRNGQGVDVAEPIAVTLDDTVYVVLRDPSSHVVYRCALSASAFSVPSPPATAGRSSAEELSSAKLPTEHLVTTIALTEDGKFLVAAHESMNQISIWNVRSAALVKSLSCPSPRSVICRGGRVYVANYGQGTITVLDPAKDWAAIAQCPVGYPDVYYLSAPQNIFFAHQILATCGKYKHRAVVLVDVASAARSAPLVERNNLGAATVDCQGTTVIEQREFDWETMGYPQAFDYTGYRRSAAVVPQGPALEQRMGLLAQAWSNALWFDENLVATGLPPTPVLRPPVGESMKAGLIVPDQSRPIFYRLQSDGIHIRAADASLAEQGRIAAELPDWACSPSDRYSRQSTADTRIVPSDVFANPVAVTLEGRAYLFAVHAGALFRFTGTVPSGISQLPAVPTSQPAPMAGQPGRLNLAAEPTFMARTRDGSAVMVIEGNSFSLLDRDGRTVTRTAALPVLYKKMFDRSNYYVALSEAGVDLLDIHTLALIRHVEFGGIGGNGGTRDVALHPSEPRCYVSLADGEVILSGGASHELPRVVEVNEQTGAVRYLRHVYGERLFVDPAGRQLAGWIPAHSASAEPPWELGVVSHFLSASPLAHPALFAFYDLNPNAVRCFCVAQDVGPEMTPDQNAVTVAGNGLLREYAVDNLQQPAVEYRSNAGARPIAFDYHPRLGIVAVSDDTGVTLYDRSTGKPRSGGHYDATGVERIVFAPSGQSICILSHEFNVPQHVLASYPLSLTPAEESVVTAATPPPSKRLEVIANVIDDPAGTVDPREIQSLRLAPQGSAMSAKQVNLRYLHSVAMVGPSQPTFTGIAVGMRGYVITCAEAIHSGNANRLWLRTPKPQRQPYASAGEVQVIRIDPERNLALLKVQAAFEFVAPLAASAPDAGESVTLLANEGNDAAGIGGVSVLTGSVSNPFQIIHGVNYLQTTVDGGYGALGAPLFDDKGALIGLMVRHTQKEGVSFAIPVSDIRDFLKECVGPPTTQPTTVMHRKIAPQVTEVNRNHPNRRATEQEPAGQVAANESPRPIAAKGSAAISVTETVWTRQVTGGTFFTSPDGQHIGWIQIDPRHPGQPGSEQGVLDGALRPFNNAPFFSDNSKHVMYFVAAAPRARPFQYVLDNGPPHLAAEWPANRRPVDFAAGGGHVGWVSTKEGLWTQFAVIDGVAGKEYQRFLCEPSFSADGTHSVYAAVTANRTFVIRDGKETVYDAPAGEVVTADGHIGIVVGQINQSHVEYDGQSQKPYEKIGGLQLSPDGKHVGYIATMSPKRFLVIDGEEKEVPVGAVDALALGPGGHYACAGGANSAQLILDGVLEGPTDVQFAGRPAITFSPEGDHIAYLVDRQERGTTPFAGGAPLPIRRQYVVLDGALQTLPDEEGNATDRLTYSADGRRLAYIVQSMSQPTLGPDGRPLIGRAGMSKMIQRLVVDGIATDTFNEIREPVFSADGKHYACFAKRAGIDPIERDDQWYIVLDGAPAPCRKPLSQVPYFDAHDIVHAYTASLGQGPWNLTDVYRMDARSK